MRLFEIRVKKKKVMPHVARLGTKWEEGERVDEVLSCKVT